MTLFRTNGSSDQWVFGPMGRQTNGFSDQWVVGPMGCRTIETSPRHWHCHWHCSRSRRRRHCCHWHCHWQHTTVLAAEAEGYGPVSPNLRSTIQPHHTPLTRVLTHSFDMIQQIRHSPSEEQYIFSAFTCQI